jgi:hypothetical protein
MIVTKANKVLILNHGIVIQSIDISGLLNLGGGISSGGGLNASQALAASASSGLFTHRIQGVVPTEKGFAVERQS